LGGIHEGLLWVRTDRFCTQHDPPCPASGAIVRL
jgi:hypothetical protein